MIILGRLRILKALRRKAIVAEVQTEVRKRRCAAQVDNWVVAGE